MYDKNSTFRWEGTVCKEAVRPTAIISAVTQDNKCTIKFSEPVIISNVTELK